MELDFVKEHRERAELVARLVRTGTKVWAQATEDAAKHADKSLLKSPNGSVASPIERAMAVALVLVARLSYYDGVGFAGTDLLSEFEVAEDFKSWAAGQSLKIAVYPQVVISDYRVDFLILFATVKSVRGIIVECDGHDFHDRTKEQALADKRRDRFLQERGYKVFRFTGSEIWRDAMGCAEQAFRTALQDITIDERPDLEEAYRTMQPGLRHGPDPF